MIYKIHMGGMAAMPIKFLSQGKSLLTFLLKQCFITHFENGCHRRSYIKHLFTLAILIVPLIVCPFSFSADITMAWDSNNESDLAGYKIYYGTSSGNYSHTEDVGNVTEYTIVDLQEGVTYFFAAKAYNYSGNESSFSEELVYTLLSTNSNNSPTKPSVPSGPSSGSTETQYNFNTSSDDPDGDPLEYRYDWGDGDLSAWGLSSQTHSWSSPGNFCVRSMAKDSYDATSGWSNCRNITISAPNTNSSPTTPSVPSGPTSGSTETQYNFNTSSDDADGDPLEYRYNWGDGNLSAWGSSSFQGHTWSSPGNFCVRSMAKDSYGATSEWSNCHNITISAPSPITHQITASAGINGRISPSGNLIVDNGANQAFTIIPNNSYHVLDVLVDGATVGAVTSYTLTNVTQNHTISATFSLNNQPPIANAGPNQTVSEGTVVTLSAKNSSDSEGKIASYFWEQTRGPSVQLSNFRGMETTFVAPDVSSWGATLSFRLAVLDEEGLQDTDNCRIIVTQESVSDEDGDGVPDSEDAFPSDPNEWLDTDGDGLGNNADGDDDDDGLPDAWELLYGLDPLTKDADEDPDGDGVVNIDEYSNETDPTIFDTNLAPNQPEIYSPTNQSMVDLIPVLEASPFYDEDVDDHHTGTQWQIFVEGNDLCILNINTGISLTSLKVPRLILTENTTYYWKVRYFDTAGRPSRWSEPAYFMTDANFADDDNDGVPDHQEVEGIQDLDGDGIDDASQKDIMVLKSEVGNAIIGISVKGSDTVLELISVEAEDPQEVQPNPAGNVPTPEDIPFGLIDYKIIVEQPGDEAVVTIYFSEAAPEGSKWYKYDPIEGIWYDYSAYSEFNEDRKSVTVLVKDGGFGDLDGIENGIIIDPAGIGVNPAGNGAITTSSGGGGWACFISAANSKTQANPSTINPWRWTHRVGIIMVFLILFVIYRRRAGAFNL